MFSKILAATAALSLVASPALAQQAAPESARPDSQVTAPEPGTESLDSSELRGRGIILPLLGLAAIILAILALTDTWPFDDEPASP
jgi:hypothetical protein